MNDAEFWDRYYNSMASIQYPEFMDRELIRRYSEGYYRNGNSTWGTTGWLGVHVSKNPNDLILMEEIISSVKPNVIIETGTEIGGSAFFFASIMQLLGIDGKVFSIDVLNNHERQSFLQKHPFIEYVEGDSSDPAILEQIKSKMPSNATVMVDLDSDHSTAHVTKELDLYSSLVTAGSYLIVEDTNATGATDALIKWISNHSEFEIDETKHRHFMTFNPNGYLKRL